MTLDDVLRELIGCLGARDDCVVGWEQVRRWPKDAMDVFQKAGWLKATAPADTIECPGCEENCFKPVKFHPAPLGQTAAAFVACDVRSEMGKVKIPLTRLQQWQLTHAQIARWIAGTLNLKGKPEKDIEDASFKLGAFQGKQRMAELRLDLNDPVSLKASGHMLPLSEITFIADGRPTMDTAAVLAMADLPPARVSKAKASPKKRIAPVSAGQNDLEVGTPQWRKQTARKAANARHDQPGGSRDKQQQIREIWATGKYSSRDRCAEEECASLDMSYSAARKALKNTPDP
jgi:hypothetical protein